MSDEIEPLLDVEEQIEHDADAKEGEEEEKPENGRKLFIAFISLLIVGLGNRIFQVLQVSLKLVLCAESYLFSTCSFQAVYPHETVCTFF